MAENRAEKDLFEPLWKTVYNKLFDDIIKLQIEPEKKISEAQIANQMDVSRSPVKMALDKLCDDGLVKKQPTGGYIVLGMSPNKCIELCDARVSLEAQAAALAAKRITVAQLDRLKDILSEYQRIEKEKDYSAYPPLDMSFHRVIIEASGNGILQRMHQEIAPQILRYHYLGVQIQSIANMSIVANHVAIYTALRNHQSNTAREEITADIENMKIAAGFLLQK